MVALPGSHLLVGPLQSLDGAVKLPLHGMALFEVQNVLTPFAFIGMPGPMEMMIILGIGVLLFGKRLPEVGRSLGKGIVEFKKGVQGIEDEIDTAASTATSSRSQASADDYVEATSPKFEPPTGEPPA